MNYNNTTEEQQQQQQLTPILSGILSKKNTTKTKEKWANTVSDPKSELQRCVLSLSKYGYVASDIVYSCKKVKGHPPAFQVGVILASRLYLSPNQSFATKKEGEREAARYVLARWGSDLEDILISIKKRSRGDDVNQDLTPQVNSISSSSSFSELKTKLHDAQQRYLAAAALMQKTLSEINRLIAEMEEAADSNKC